MNALLVSLADPLREMTPALTRIGSLQLGYYPIIVVVPLNSCPNQKERNWPNHYGQQDAQPSALKKSLELRGQTHLSGFCPAIPMTASSSQVLP
jgi:hypothetical protein